MKTVDCVNDDYLQTCPIGEQVQCKYKDMLCIITVMARGYGRTLMSYSIPYDGCLFWSWSRTGGSSHGNDMKEALVDFEKELISTKKFWDERVNNPKLVVVKGQAYGIGPKETNRSYCGFGGDKFVMRNLTTGEIGHSCNMWHCGWVPEEYNKADTHEFLDSNTPAPEVFGTDKGWGLNDAQHAAATH